MKKIVVIGSGNVDTTLHVKDFPKPGETINALDITTCLLYTSPSPRD